MVKRRFVCTQCHNKFEIEVLEPGEAEEENIRTVRVRCPECGGPVKQI